MEYGNMRVVDLKALTKEHGLRGYSKLRKAELITFLQNNLRSNLSDIIISNHDAQKVWKRFSIRNMGEDHNLYLKTDVFLPSNMFEAFRSTCLKHHGLGPAHFYTSPG